jgi:hypothetical protein
MKLSPRDIETLVINQARLQARQETMECVLRAFIVSAPPLHPLLWQALHTAQTDLGSRWTKRRPDMTPELDAAGLALLNELRSACAPPASSGTDVQPPARPGG